MLRRRYKSTAITLTVALLLTGGMARAQERQDSHAAQNKNEHAQGNARPAPSHAQARPPAPPAEVHPGPRGYPRISEPQGWNARPQAVDRAAYQHNYQAPRAFKSVPITVPNWAAHHRASGQILPRAYWAQEYLIADYWLFNLEVPPPGYEWVRDDDDAILVGIGTGGICK